MGAERALLAILSLGAVLLAPVAGAEPPVPAAKRLLLWEQKDLEALLQAVPSPHHEDRRFAAIIRAFALSYPKDFVGLEFPAGAPVRVLLANARSLLYDDGQKKSFAEMLEHPDLEDCFSQIYPLSNPTDKLPENFDPGRFRMDEMFTAIYGDSEAAVRANCAQVDFCGQKVSFNDRAGAATALRAVAEELTTLFQTKPEWRVYAEKLGGTFVWRKIAGSDRLSNHSFGVAIDVNTSKSAYWKWEPAASLATYSRLRFPQPIIEAFERHGFIWGGKWYHYDTMHFEYRPELLAYARAMAEPK